MSLYHSLPVPSDRMGMLWSLSTIKDACILEYGTTGTTRFSMQSLRQFGGGPQARVFTTGLEKSDLTFGSHKKVEQAVKELDTVYHPKYIFVMASSATAVIGLDIESICRLLQDDTAARLIPITTGGFQGDYALGVRNALKLLCEEVVQPAEQTVKGTYNIIGSQIDSLNFAADVKEINDTMRSCFGYECHTVFTSDTSIDEIEQASQAELNLVIRSEGIEAAKILKERFGQSYIEGLPFGLKDTLKWLGDIGKVIGKEPDAAIIKDMNRSCSEALDHAHEVLDQKEAPKVTVAGNYDLVRGLMQMLNELGFEEVNGIVNHRMKGGDYMNLLDDHGDEFRICPSEEEKLAGIDDTAGHLVLGDGSLLGMLEHCEKIQVSTPSVGRGISTGDIPFIGFNGLVHLSQEIINTCI